MYVRTYVHTLPWLSVICLPYTYLQGISQQQREYFELSSDDERQCKVCKTCCFLSAVRCPCTPNHLACPHHVTDLCPCPLASKVLRYRYTLDELRGMLKALQDRAEAYQTWLRHVEALLDGEQDEKPGVCSLSFLLSPLSPLHTHPSHPFSLSFSLPLSLSLSLSLLEQVPHLDSNPSTS